MTPTLMKKKYETPETEIFVVKVENFCDTYTMISKMEEPEDL